MPLSGAISTANGSQLQMDWLAAWSSATLPYLLLQLGGSSYKFTPFMLLGTVAHQQFWVIITSLPRCALPLLEVEVSAERNGAMERPCPNHGPMSLSVRLPISRRHALLHLFVHFSFFHDVWDEYSKLLISDTEHILSDSTLPASILLPRLVLVARLVLAFALAFLFLPGTSTPSPTTNGVPLTLLRVTASYHSLRSFLSHLHHSIGGTHLENLCISPPLRSLVPEGLLQQGLLIARLNLNGVNSYSTTRHYLLHPSFSFFLSIAFTSTLYITFHVLLL